jgi:hypothetical protein
MRIPSGVKVLLQRFYPKGYKPRSCRHTHRDHSHNRAQSFDLCLRTTRCNTCLRVAAGKCRADSYTCSSRLPSEFPPDFVLACAGRVAQTFGEAYSGGGRSRRQEQRQEQVGQFVSCRSLVVPRLPLVALLFNGESSSVGPQASRLHCRIARSSTDGSTHSHTIADYRILRVASVQRMQARRLRSDRRALAIE